MIAQTASGPRTGVPFPPPASPKFTFIDLFAGVGGFRLAMQSIGGKCVFSSEWNPSAQQTYLANYGELPFGDITKEETKSRIPRRFDVLCAGFPCQPFSRAGVSARVALNRASGFQDETQGTLFFDVLTILKRHRPKVAFLENVRNLALHDNGRTFDIIKGSIEELGYSFHWKIIDASPLVPQKRVRCYMVCVRNGGRFEFPEIEGPPIPLRAALEANPDPVYTISDNLWRGHQNRTSRNIERGAGFTAFTTDLDKPAHTLVARYYKDGKECLIPQKGKNPRMLTKREAARLQGFPEEFILPKSRTETYRQMGNSVAVPVLKAIAESIDDQIKLAKPQKKGKK
jgi:DNA (cytosine-5)-methyltransferase 1